MSYERTEGKNHWNSLNTGLNLTHNLQNFSIWDWNVSLSLFWLNKTYIFFPSDNIVSYCNSHGYLILMLNRVRIYGRFSRGSLFQLITWHKLTATYILFLRFLLTFLFLIILVKLNDEEVGKTEHHNQGMHNRATAADDHTGCLSCQLKARNWFYNHRLTKTGQQKIRQMSSSLMNCDLCIAPSRLLIIDQAVGGSVMMWGTSSWRTLGSIVPTVI